MRMDGRSLRMDGRMPRCLIQVESKRMFQGILKVGTLCLSQSSSIAFVWTTWRNRKG